MDLDRKINQAKEADVPLSDIQVVTYLITVYSGHFDKYRHYRVSGTKPSKDPFSKLLSFFIISPKTIQKNTKK